MGRSLVVVIPNLAQEYRAAIVGAADKAGFDIRFYQNAAEAQGALAEAEVIFGAGPGLAKDAKKLRWLCVTSAGVDAYMKPGAFAAPDALFTNSSGAYGVTIAEHAVMMTLEVMRRQMEYNAIVARREWTRNLPIRSIKNCRVTMLGTGDIGQETAKRIRAFEPKTLIGVNRSGKNPGGLFDSVVPCAQLEDVLPETDLLIMSLPGTAETVHMMNREKLALLPKDAFLVNVGRGTVVDQKALQALMEEGHLAGAALDVFEQEPVPAEDPIWDCPRLLITPHSAGNMTLPYTVERIVGQFLEDFERYCAGEPLARLVDRKLGY